MAYADDVILTDLQKMEQILINIENVMKKTGLRNKWLKDKSHDHR